MWEDAEGAHSKEFGRINAWTTQLPQVRLLSEGILSRQLPAHCRELVKIGSTQLQFAVVFQLELVLSWTRIVS